MSKVLICGSEVKMVRNYEGLYLKKAYEILGIHDFTSKAERAG